MSTPEPVIPHSGQRRRYRPEVGHTLTVDLPGESVRAKVEGVVNEDACVCTIESTPIATPRHSYVKDDTICVRREVNGIGIENWAVISEREMQQRERVARFEEEERAKAAAADADRVSEIREKDLAAQAQAKAEAELAATPWYKRPKG